MRNNEENGPNQETRISSCPYPVTMDQMPMPMPMPPQTDDAAPTIGDGILNVNNETVPVGMLSPYYRDRIVPQDNFPITGLSDEGTELINFRNSNNAVNEEDITLMEQIPVALPIGFKTVDVQMDSSPTAPPPSYTELFSPTVVEEPTAVITEAPTIPSDTTSSRHRNENELQPIADRRTTPVTRNRTSTSRTDVQSSPRPRTVVVPRSRTRTNAYQNITENRPSSDNSLSVCAAAVIKVLAAFIVLVAIYYILKAAIMNSAWA